MIDGLVVGKLSGAAEMRDGKNASRFAVAKVKVASEDGEPLIVNVIAFAVDTCAELMALHDGDSLALSGSLTPKVWVDKQGNSRPVLDMVANQILTAYHLARKQDAMAKIC